MSERDREARFSTLRESLDALGYTQPLGVASFALVECLHADLAALSDEVVAARNAQESAGAFGVWCFLLVPFPFCVLLIAWASWLCVCLFIVCGWGGRR